jgi:hypothetical protein
MRSNYPLFINHQPTLNYFNYFTEIEETFIRRRGKHLLLSPLDWALIESWQEREIPLRIILRGIENVFDAIEKNPNRQMNIKSLTYCRDEVEAQYADWQKTQVGKSSAESEIKEDPVKPVEETNGQNSRQNPNESNLFSAETIQFHLENTLQAIEKAKAKSDGALRQVLEKVAGKISEHKKTDIDAESLEESLNELEGLIDRTLLEANDEQILGQLSQEVEKELAGHKLKMEQDVYKRTFDLMLLKKLREKTEIPPLSLFYL